MEPTSRALRPLDPILSLTEEFVRAHQAMVWRHLRFLGAPPALADDLTQEAFMVLLRTEVECRGDRAAAAWLCTTARRLFFRTGRRPRAALELLGDEALERAWSTVAEEANPRLEALEDCLQNLPNRSRRALDLRYRQGARRAEIAEALGVSEEGAKTLLRRVREALAECVEARLSEDQR